MANSLKTTSIIITVLMLLMLLPSCSTRAAYHIIKNGVRVEQRVEDQQEVEEYDNPFENLADQATISIADAVKPEDVPGYEGKPYVMVNGNKPEFDDSLKTGEDFENYGDFDKYRRCTKAVASLSVDTQPSGGEARGDISMVHPSGWKSGMGWERCHLIGWQLCGENANAKNLVTGTHYMNVSGMLPFENRVDWYISETGNHVLYEVEPVFEGKNMVCSGVHMQAESVEDNGNGISFNVYCFNVSPGKKIDYKTGEVYTVDEQLAAENSFERVYVLNTNSYKFHYPSCSSVAQMADHNKEVVTDSREELINRGFSPCGNCEP